MELSFGKKVLFSVLLGLLTLLFVELCLHTVFFFRQGRFWNLGEPHEVFNVRSFTELTHDARVVTNRKEFRGKPDPHATWTVETDRNGFRVGRNRYEGFARNVIFMGDSVPFGWGTEGAESYPSYFFELTRQAPAFADAGVINAAVPSYSITQAHQRYAKEVKGKFPASLVVVQTYDPVSQFVLWGRDWTPAMSWSSRNTLEMTKKVAAARLFARFSEYSGILYTVRKFWEKFRPEESLVRRVEAGDQEAFRLFREGVTGVLEAFYRDVDAEGSRLVLLPVNPVRLPVDCAKMDGLGFQEFRYCVVPFYNQILADFAASHPKVSYLDVRERFMSEADQGDLFTDACCHLSPKGSRLVATFLAEKLAPPVARERGKAAR